MKVDFDFQDLPTSVGLRQEMEKIAQSHVVQVWFIYIRELKSDVVDPHHLAVSLS